MSRNKLSQQEKAEREAEKAELLASRKKHTKNLDTNNQMTETTNVTDELSGDQQKPNEQPSIVSTENENTDSSESNVEPKSNLDNNFQPDTTFSPMGGNKVKRTYSQPELNPALANTIIDEPVIITETLGAEKTAQLLSEPKLGEKKEPILPPIEGFNELSPNDKKLAAEKTTDLLLGVYDRLHWFGRKFVSVDMEDLLDEHRRGDINMHYEAFENEDDPDGGITIKEYFEDFNKQVEDEFVVSEEFKKDVRPPLERIIMKRGWGASDEMYLAFKFGEDIAIKTGILIGFKKLTNKYMNEFREDHAKIKRVAQEMRRQEEAEKKEKIRQQNAIDRLPDEIIESIEPNLAETQSKSVTMGDTEK
jgi:hypothetical protein